MLPTTPSVHYRIRVSFDLDVDYQMNPLVESDADLADLRSRLMEEDAVFKKMAVNHCLHKLEHHLGGMISRGGLLGYDDRDLLNVIARTLPSEKILPLLDAELFGTTYTDPIAFEAFNIQVSSMQAVDLESDQPINLEAPAEQLILSRKRSNYMIAKTESESLIVVRGSYFEDLPGGGLERFLVEIDQAVKESRDLNLTITLMNCGIFAGSKEQFDLAVSTIRAHCAKYYAGMTVDFFWKMIRSYSKLFLESSNRPSQ
jgi:hypothetical protein